MGKNDSTKYLKQMFHRPNIVPFANVLLTIILLFFVVAPVCTLGYCPYIDTPTAINYDVEPLYASPVINIYGNGKICMDGCFISDLSKLHYLIIENIEKSQPEEDKIFLKIEGDVPFGRVQEILSAVKKAHVEKVGLITQEYASYAHFLWPAKE